MRRDGEWVRGVGAFIQLFPSSLLTAHPEPGSSPETSMDSSSVCVKESYQLSILKRVFLPLSVCLCVFVFPHPAVGGGVE